MSSDTRSAAFREYCQWLGEDGARNEAQALNNARLLPQIWAALSVPAVVGVATSLQTDLPAPWPWLLALALLAILLSAPPLIAGYLRDKWRRERPLLLAHMRDRVFGMQQLQEFLAAQGNGADAAAGLTGLSRDSIQRFIEFYVESSMVSGRSYYFLGRQQGNRELLRALLQQLLAEELLSGAAAFDEDSADELVVPASEAVIERRAWRPPSRSALLALLSHAEDLETSALRSGGYLLGSVIGLSVGIGVYIALYSSFVPLAWLAAAAATVFSTAGLSAVLSRTRRAHWERYKERHWSELDWDIFNNGVLRDYVNSGRGGGFVMPATLTGCLFTPLGMRYRPLPAETAQLGDFARHYLTLERLSPQHQRAGEEDISLRRAFVLEVTARGLLRLIDEAPEEFKRW